ncbi:MAG: PilT/PilU family type 4a pilus ATPase [Lentisphaeria bacterium]|nr:PilT/PilU family type 4a pilus ATPase [Lentisphaeria bacterium]
MAIQEARSVGFPPESVFDDGPRPTAAETPPVPPSRGDGGKERQYVEDRTEGARGAAAPPPVAAAGAPSAPWLRGWPDLSQAEGQDPEGACELLQAFLHKAREQGCSDVHISAGSYPFVRKHKEIYLLTDQKPLTRETAEILNMSPLDDRYRERFLKAHDLDYCYAVGESDRYRTNILMQRLGVAGSYRIIDARLRSLHELGFPRPEVFEKLTTYQQGLILITGPVGCGKSATLASMVDLINRTRQDHIVVVEDPIEVVFQPMNCNITQRELNSHTLSFGNALRGALREDPDIIVIGELRDLDTIEMAIRAAETGHLVFGTLHTGSAATTMDRLLDVFPPNQQAQVRAMAAESLKAIICQQLLPNSDGSGVVLACEVLLGTLAVSNLIREGKTFQLDSIIQTGRNLGMSTMEQSYVDLYLAGKRTYEQTKPLVKSSELIRQMQTEEARRMASTAAGKKRR